MKRRNKQIDIEQAMLELYKGKLTTNPSCHSGEGIFFSSKMLTEFAILSDNTIFHFAVMKKKICSVTFDFILYKIKEGGYNGSNEIRK